MGTIDRGYMSDPDDEGYSTPSLSAFISPLAVLIFINIAVFLLWQFAKSKAENGDFEAYVFMTKHFLCSYDGVFKQGRVHTLLTSALSHEALMHIFFNMYMFYLLGKYTLTRFKGLSFYALYVATAVAASLAWCMFTKTNGTPRLPALGASGAVMGISAAAAVLYPRLPMLLFFVPMPLWMVMIVYAGLDVFGAFDRSASVAHAAHLGGAVAGLVITLAVGRYKKRPAPLDDALPDRAAWSVARPERIGQSSPDERPRRGGVDPETARRVDALLHKISTQGPQSLTDEERAFMRDASSKYDA